MAFQPVPNTASVTLFFEGTGGGILSGCEAQSAFYVNRDAGVWNAAAVQELADYTFEWWDAGKNAGAALKASVANDWVLRRIIAKDLEAENGTSYVLTANAVGTRNGDAVPPNCPMWIKFVGESGSLPKDGGVFLPVGIETDLDGTFFTGAFATAVQQLVTDWRTDLNDPGAGGVVDWAHVIVSRSQSTNDDVKDARAALRAAIAATRRATAVVNNVTSIAARELLGSQRDRRAD
jgi:hypothetical protein